MRSIYLKYPILPTIENFLKNIYGTSKITNGVIVERGSGGGHKTKVLKKLAGMNTDYFCIEPSKGMRENAEKKLQGSDVSILDGYAQDLIFGDNQVDLICDIQMLHHHDEQVVRKMLQEAHRVLKPGGCLYILDTFIPPDDTIFSGVKKKIFEILTQKYSQAMDNSQYNNVQVIKMQELLIQSDFEIKHIQGFKVFLGHILGYNMTTQIFAIKN